MWNSKNDLKKCMDVEFKKWCLNTVEVANTQSKQNIKTSLCYSSRVDKSQ